MARGGYRPGGGRPKGARNKSKADDRAAPPTEVAQTAPTASTAKQQTPLEYMLGVMNDITTEASRRDRMAIAAAPFVHARADAAGGGKRERAAEDAKTAGAGTSWGDDLTPRTTPLN